MASEVISHAIFASSHPTPLRTASSSTPPPTPRFAPHLALHFTPHPTLHSASHSALHPPRTPSCPSPCAPTPFHTTHFHRTSLLHRIPLAKSLPSTHFPSASLHPSMFLSQVPSPSIPPELHPASHPALHPA